MTTLRALLVDDEPSARERLARLLAEHPHVTVVGEAPSVAAAAPLCRSASPDIVFLDVQLRTGSGFELLPHLTPATAVVFVTAYDEFAVRAFEVNALDYLLKPVHPDRLFRALQRLDASISKSAPRDDEDASVATSRATPPVAQPVPLRESDLVALRDERGLRMVPLRRITHIEAEENYTRVHVANEPPAFVRRTMLEWDRLLPEREFLRVSRSLVVQLAAVREIRSESRDVARVQLAGQPDALTVARRPSARIRQALQGR
jgi:two-component system LytT family response regulator